MGHGTASRHRAGTLLWHSGTCSTAGFVTPCPVMPLRALDGTRETGHINSVLDDDNSFHATAANSPSGKVVRVLRSSGIRTWQTEVAEVDAVDTVLQSGGLVLATPGCGALDCTVTRACRAGSVWRRRGLMCCREWRSSKGGCCIEAQ
ncbi:hypothetical protein CMUS01_09002 [Colletotrichum musicola]|uniref:Uncharacterized protein n=1 Tax=Colletotrichum musicola TaxID=2175873 RepID=A0A8H6NCE7_9PEZI|nr:hypothetical protein CMUS01_09002 [Colletotrichum musicola]